MSHRTATKIVPWACSCVLIGLARWASACDIPVHRWALERWAPDSYPVFVFHEEALSSAQRAALDRLVIGAGHANLAVRTIDVASALDDFTRALWEAQSASVMPWIVVRHPMAVPADVAIWAGPLEEATVEAVLDSPKRREVAEYLSEADAVVWILLDGDNEAAKSLADALDDVHKDPPLPTPTPGAPAAATTFPLPRFPVIRVSRTDPAEQVFAQMLLGVEPDLRNYDEPMAFPVFGRGRALYALVGAGINGTTVRKACGFLVNGCSCQVKEQNPGMDLLFAVDWTTRIGEVLPAEAESPPPLPGLPQQVVVAAAPVDTSAGIARNLATALVLGALAVASATAIVWRLGGRKFHG